MEYEKELINMRIENMKDPVQKIMLQDVLKDVFRMVMDYSENRFTALEDRINQELEVPEETYGIVTGVCKRDSVDRTSSYLYEVAAEEENSWEIVDTVFLACGHDTIARYIGKQYIAKVETEEHTCHIPVTLRYSRKYLEKIEWLYRQFYQNHKSWRTVNCPYLYKFLDIVDTEHKLPVGEPIKKVVLDLEEAGGYLHTDMVLVWNIEEFKADTQAAVIPGEKAVFYEHKIDLPRAALSCLAVLEEEESFYTIYNQEAILIRTETRGYDSIKLLRIAKEDPEKDNTRLLYPLQSNKQNIRRMDKLAYYRPKFVCTMGELQRMMTSYEACEGLRLERACIKDPADYGGWDCNYFIPAHRLADKRRVLLLSFLAVDKNDIFLYEKMNFLLSELQLHTDEYQCAGEIL